MRIFMTRWFRRFARKEHLADEMLLDAVRRAERGQIDADLGGGVIKQRVARPGPFRRLPDAPALPIAQPGHFRFRFRQEP